MPILQKYRRQKWYSTINPDQTMLVMSQVAQTKNCGQILNDNE